jgi:hypothetical protein
MGKSADLLYLARQGMALKAGGAKMFGKAAERPVRVITGPARSGVVTVAAVLAPPDRSYRTWRIVPASLDS